MNDFTLLLKSTRKNLMTGVSYMIPFVVAGGILLALSVLISGGTTVPAEGVLADIAQIGITGLGLMVPILSGYIAFSMADRPGLAPGIIGGMLANTIGAGFIGGIISGLLAGTVVYYMKKIKVGPSLRSVMPILIIPLFSTIIVGGAMLWVVGTPIASLMTAMTDWLSGMGTENLAVLALVLGVMTGFDLGGPINKVAFGFSSAMIGTIDPATGLPSPTALAIMAGVGVAICVPPIGMGLATILAPKKFTTEEHDSGKAAIIMGLVGITEGAITICFSRSDESHPKQYRWSCSRVSLCSRLWGDQLRTLGRLDCRTYLAKPVYVHCSDPGWVSCYSRNGHSFEETGPSQHTSSY